MTEDKNIPSIRVKTANEEEKRSNPLVQARPEDQKRSDAIAAAVHTPDDFNKDPLTDHTTSIANLPTTPGMPLLVAEKLLEAASIPVDDYTTAPVSELDPSTLLDDENGDD